MPGSVGEFRRFGGDLFKALARASLTTETIGLTSLHLLSFGTARTPTWRTQKTWTTTTGSRPAEAAWMSSPSRPSRNSRRSFTAASAITSLFMASRMESRRLATCIRRRWFPDVQAYRHDRRSGRSCIRARPVSARSRPARWPCRQCCTRPCVALYPKGCGIRVAGVLYAILQEPIRKPGAYCRKTRYVRNSENATNRSWRLRDLRARKTVRRPPWQRGNVKPDRVKAAADANAFGRRTTPPA